MLRAFIGSMIICLLAMLWSGNGFSQDINTETDPNQPLETSQTNIQTLPDGLDASKLDLNDPELKAAIDARKAAQAALQDADESFVDAVIAQIKENETPSPITEPVESGPAISLDTITETGRSYMMQVLEWLKSPAFLAQIGAVLIAYFLAPLLARILRRRLFFFREEPKADAKLLKLRQYVFRIGKYLRQIAFIALLAAFGFILKAVGKPLGEKWLVTLVQGIAVVYLLYKAIQEFIGNDLLKKLSIWILIPVALIAVFGRFGEFTAFLENTPVIPMDPPVTAMTIVRLAIFGGLFFWLGNIGNTRGQSAIRAQEGLDMATREVVAKIFQMILFVIIVVMVMTFAGIPLSGLVMIISAIGLGIGLGLQPVAANFVSGIIILFDRSVRKGDFVVLPDGQEGFVEAINMRSTTVETTDGKDIMVPNTTFIENTYENWTHKDPAQRYEVYFKVPYDTDIDKLEDIIIPAIQAYDKVLMEPEEPDLELREFGEYGIHFAVEFWASGIDDGENKFTSDLNFIVWRTLRDAGITMPIPRREVKNL